MAFKLIILCLFLCVCHVFLKLEEVLIFIRHNIRQPVTENLKRFGVDIWPASTYKAGQLTSKGAILEKYMGEYIVNWLKMEELLPSDCPNYDNVYIYANTLQRTRETAIEFVNGAFPSCDVRIHSIDSDEMDPVFNTSDANTPQQMKDFIAEEMENNLNKLDLQYSYLELDKVVDLTNTTICKEEYFCSFANSSDNFFYKIGKEPELIGPLKYGNKIVDAYLTAYYEGFTMKSIADGEIENWERLMGKIAQAHQIVDSHSPHLAREAAKPLLRYIFNAIASDRKLILMVGHDSNIQSLIDALDFKDFTLPDQLEKTPIGGKLVFQKWNDQSGKKLLKIRYVYQTTRQLREGVQVSEENPPQWDGQMGRFGAVYMSF